MDDLELKECFRAKLKKDSVQKVFKGLSQKDMKALALIALKDLKRQVERLEELRVEREAFTQVPSSNPPAEIDRDLEHFQEMFDSPEKFYGSNRTSYVGNGKKRKKFRKWMEENELDFDEWHLRAESVCSEAMADMFGGDWHDGGVRAYDRWQSLSVIGPAIDIMVADLVKKTTLHVTQELLGTEFCVGDGRRGEASKDDHEQRIAMLRTNSVANIEAEARHKKAIELLTEAGVSCLKELPVESLDRSNEWAT